MEFQRNYNLINSKFWEFFFPTLFTSMAGNVCLFIDTVLISFFLGSTSLSAIQVISPLTTFVNLLYWTVGLGGSIICVAAKAKFENEKSNDLFSVSIISITLIGIIITVLCLIFSTGIISFLSHSSFDSLAFSYFNLYIFGLPFLCYMMSLTYFVRADGLSRLPFKALLVSNTINLLFDVIFMKFLNLGISGAALALIIGYIAGSLMMSTYFFNSKRTLSFVKVKIFSFLKYFVEICKSGFSGASNFLYSTIVVFAYNYLILHFIGYDGLSALNICSNTLFITSIIIIIIFY